MSPLAHPSMPSFQWGAVIAASLVAAVIDARVRRIPNWLTGPFFLCGLMWAGWNSGMAGVLDAMGAAVLLALPYVILFTIAGGGAADAKLMGALGAWLGVSNGCIVLVAVCISGAVMGIGYALIKGQARGVLCNIAVICFGLAMVIAGRRKWSEAAQMLPSPRHMLAIPYGVAAFIGVCATAAMIYARNTGGV
ncbi:MAG: type prepilin leader peptidase family protein [Phycisphaerales bacterium]|nr:type prepilin leader peptidase family protein [Phycisphaerales bacterium]